MKSPGQTLYEELTRTNTGGGVPSLSRCESGAAAVLSAQWRPVSEPPLNPYADALLADGCGHVCLSPFTKRDTHLWLSIPPLPTPPKPTPEEKERAEFDAWIISQGGKPGVCGSETEAIKTVMWLGWQGARASKEGAKP